MQAWLDGQMARKDCPFSKVKLKPANYTGWIGQLSTWSSDPDSDEIGLTDAARARLTTAGLRDAVKPPLAPMPVLLYITMLQDYGKTTITPGTLFLS